MKLINILWFRKDVLTDDMKGKFILPTVYFNWSEPSIMTLKILYISFVWFRWVRTTELLFDLDKPELTVKQFTKKMREKGYNI